MEAREDLEVLERDFEKVGFVTEVAVWGLGCSEHPLAAVSGPQRTRLHPGFEASVG